MQKVVRRISVEEKFQVSTNTPIPDAPVGGARVKVHYAGACYTERQILKAGRRRPKMGGIQDTSLYPGYEISGVIDSLCNTVATTEYKVGDRVIVYPEDDDMEDLQDGYVEYLTVKDVRNLVKVPDTMRLQVAAMLPSGALAAMSAVERVRPLVLHKINQKRGKGPVNLLVVGAGALGLWTITLARHEFSDLHIACADVNIEKLMVAKEQGCSDVIHWNDSLHEEYLIERTKNVCKGGVDIIIDFSSSPRTINRSMKVLGQNGALVVGGNSKYDVSFCLHSLAQKQQCILGVSKGTRDQLEQLVNLVATQQVKPPAYHIFPVDEANNVFDKLNQCKINGRAVLEICPTESDDLA
jgi:D-arabinose 1-dehydrogenase-like Zn-dependent alcohol dehydrogenase